MDLYFRILGYFAFAVYYKTCTRHNGLQPNFECSRKGRTYLDLDKVSVLALEVQRFATSNPSHLEEPFHSVTLRKDRTQISLSGDSLIDHGDASYILDRFIPWVGQMHEHDRRCSTIVIHVKDPATHRPVATGSVIFVDGH